MTKYNGTLVFLFAGYLWGAVPNSLGVYSTKGKAVQAGKDKLELIKTHPLHVDDDPKEYSFLVTPYVFDGDDLDSPTHIWEYTQFRGKWSEGLWAKWVNHRRAAGP